MKEPYSLDGAIRHESFARADRRGIPDRTRRQSCGWMNRTNPTDGAADHADHRVAGWISLSAQVGPDGPAAQFASVRSPAADCQRIRPAPLARSTRKRTESVAPGRQAPPE